MNIFIHYLDKELLDIYLPANYHENLIKKVLISIKIALLLLENEECIYIPASNYFESILARNVLENFRDIGDMNYICMISSSSTLRKFVEKKKIVYPSLYTKKQSFVEEQILDKSVPGTWTKRERSATDDIIFSWERNINNSLWHELFKICNYKKVNSFERAMASIPRKLEKKAFVVNHVFPELNINLTYKEEAREIINKAISKYYIESFLKEYNAVCFSDFFLLPQANDILPIGYAHINYAFLCRKLAGIAYKNGSLYSYIEQCNNYELLLLKEKCILQEVFENSSDKKIISIIKEKKRMKTFIVHGHDGEVKLALKNYLQNTLKLEEPIILAEKASGGLTIIEKFEKYSEDCNLVFVLLTPDDKYTDDEMCRARQNIIFEMGYFLGKLGRKSGRVILLYKGKLELPNDISGLIYINIDNGVEAAGEEIRREINEIM